MIPLITKNLNSMKLITPTILSLLFIFNLSAQDEPTYEGWKFGCNFSPEMGYRTLKSNGSDPSMTDETIIRLRNEREKPSLISTTGISAEYRFSKLISLRTGLHYSLRGDKSDIQLVNLTPTGYILVAEGKVRNQYHFFGIPLNMVMYIINKPRFQLFSSIGAGLDFLSFTSSRSKLNYTDGRKEKDFKTYARDEFSYNNFNVLHASFYGSVGIDYKVGTKWKIRLEPNFKRNITPLVNNAPIVEKSYNVGVNLGIVYSLK